MSLYHDGVRDFDKTDDTAVRGKGSAIVEDSEKDTSFEDDCRGFTKVPSIVVQRMDVSKYLRPKDTVDPVPAPPRKSILKKSVYLDQFKMRCAVNIFKDDLGKLKEAISRSELDTSTDMDKLKCKICAKVYSSVKRLQNHKKNKHMIVYKTKNVKPKKKVSFSDHVVVHELKEYHKCRKCPEIFEGYRTLKTHMKQKHKKRTCYICNYCSKRFVDRMFFKVHIKLHCNVCGLLLSNKSKYLDHRRNVCGVFKTYKCKTCGDAFCKIMDMKDHSYSHMDGVFVCDICKDQCKSLCSLAHHISFLHSENRPTSLYTMRNLGSERLYLCNFCEESSVERDIIENHIELLPDFNNRVMTGYKDYYFCDHCFMNFDTEPDMVQHKWTHFLLSSDNSQLRVKDDVHKKKAVKTLFKLDEGIPEYMQPNVVLTKLQSNKISTEITPSIDVHNEKVLTETTPSIEVSNEKVLTEPTPSIDVNNEKVLTEPTPSTDVNNEKVFTEPTEFIDVNNEKVLTEPTSSIDVNNEKVSTESTSSIDVNNHVLTTTTPSFNVNNELLTETTPSIDENNFDILKGILKKPIIDPKSKKTILSKHQCETCNKYFSNNFCLSRHIATQHGDFENLRCNVCEEVFVWPSLLRSHKCIRTFIPEHSFDDSRPEIHFENGPINRTYTNGFSELPFEDLGINYDDDYNMNNVDFEIPAPIVELRESNAVCVPNSTAVTRNGNIPSTLNQLLLDETIQNSSYKITLQEVPIEF